MVVGDSKTFAPGGSGGGGVDWETYLLASLQATTPRNWTEDQPSTGRAAQGGVTTAGMAAQIDTFLSNMAWPKSPEYILINLGANDAVSVPIMADEATWKTHMTYIVNALKAKFQNARIYLAQVWLVSYDSQCDVLDGWIADVVASTGVYLGHDERIWMKGSDNGATMTRDGVHPSAAGNIECAAQWKIKIGY